MGGGEKGRDETTQMKERGVRVMTFGGDGAGALQGHRGRCDNRCEAVDFFILLGVSYVYRGFLVFLFCVSGFVLFS